MDLVDTEEADGIIIPIEAANDTNPMGYDTSEA
jgi:hypothetical protein